MADDLQVSDKGFDSAAAPPMPSGFGGELSGLAQKLEQGTSETLKKLDETRPAKMALLDKLASEKVPAPPEIAPPEKPTPGPEETSPVKKFGSVASALAIFGSLLSRRPLTNALNSSAAAMNAIKANDAEAYKKHLDEWKQQSEYAGKVAQWQADRYRAAMDQYKGNHDGLMSQLGVIAALDQDTTMQHTIRTGDLALVEKVLDDRYRMVKDLKDYQLRAAEFADKHNTPEYWATQQFKKENPNATAHDWVDFNRSIKLGSFNDYLSPVEIEVTDQDGKAHQQLAQQNKATGLWVTADEKRIPIASDSIKVLGKSAPVSGREAVFTQRVLTSGLEAARDLENVVNLPTTASTGIFGGRAQGPSIMDAGREVLANKLTSQEAQSYNVMATGFQRSLATIEATGLAPQGTLSHQMDTVLFKEGDTNLTKLQKLAQIRQIVEAGMQIVADNSRLSKEQQEQASKINERLIKAVPFTQTDLMKLQIAQADNPNMTLREYAQSQRPGGKADLKEQPVPPAYKDKADGTVVYDKDGHAYQKLGDKLVPM